VARRRRRRHRSVGSTIHTTIGVNGGSGWRRNGRIGRMSVVVGISVPKGAHHSALVRSHVIRHVILKVERGAALGTEGRARRAEVELRVTATRSGSDTKRGPTHEHLPRSSEVIRGHQRPSELIRGHARPCKGAVGDVLEQTHQERALRDHQP
jgi:hypothetical protein